MGFRDEKSVVPFWKIPALRQVRKLYIYNIFIIMLLAKMSFKSSFDRVVVVINWWIKISGGF